MEPLSTTPAVVEPAAAPPVVAPPIVASPVGAPPVVSRTGKRPRGRESVWDMVRSMGLVLLTVLGVLLVSGTFWASKPNPVAVVDAAGISHRVPSNLGFSPVVPVVLAEGWRATSARWTPSGIGGGEWHIGYVTPQAAYAEVGQFVVPKLGNVDSATAAQVLSDWISHRTRDGVEQGTYPINGVQWKLLVNSARQTSLVLSAPLAGGTMITVVGGAADQSEIVGLATAAGLR